MKKLDSRGKEIHSQQEKTKSNRRAKEMTQTDEDDKGKVIEIQIDNESSTNSDEDRQYGDMEELIYEGAGTGTIETEEEDPHKTTGLHSALWKTKG